MKLTIDRAKLIKHILYTFDDCGCTMGHYLIACGVDPKVIRGLNFPSCILGFVPLENECAYKTLDNGVTRLFVREIIKVNDSMDGPPREAKLKKLCAKHLDCELEFTGEYVVKGKD